MYIPSAGSRLPTRLAASVRGRSGQLLLLLILTCGFASCRTGPGDQFLRELRSVWLPDVSTLHPAVQEQARDRYDRLQAVLARDASPAERGEAFGAFGMLLHAAAFKDAAEPAYLNAQDLMPADMRWPYYLGHLYRDGGDLQRAEAAFGRVLQIRDHDLATLIWLGRIYLDLGRPEDAGRMFMRAARMAPDAIAVLAGQGRAALMKGDHAGAIQLFERALALDPTAESLHAPLAAAYRAAGDPAKAEPHLKGWGNRDILVPDPLHQELDMLLESGLANELRGVRALEARDFASAAGYFRRGLALTPDEGPLRRSLRHKLGTALYAMGDEDGAVEEFRQVVRDVPAGSNDEAAGRAHYSLGVIMTSRGDYREARRHLAGAVLHQPAYVEARVALGELLRRTGDLDASLPHYEEALRLDPQVVQARWGSALALLRLERYREAEQVLTEAVTRHPDRAEFKQLLARVLAAAPDASVRDGERAAALVQELLEGQKTTDVGETLAMTLAELGDYGEAAAVQRGVLQALRNGGSKADIRRVEANLHLFERGRPLRTLWLGGYEP